jgi:hypothetical protein
MGTKKILHAALAVAVSGLIPVGIALADTIANDIDASIDATLENIDLTVGGPDGTVHYTVNATIGDGKNGCNLVAGKTLTVNVASSNTSVATVSPSSFTFDSCANVKTLTVTAVAAGTATITLSEVSNTTAGSFDLSSASFTATVVLPPPTDTTGPEISVDLTPDANGDGWNNSDVTVVWTVNDPESSISSTTGCDTVIVTDEGSTELTCEATSDGGTSSESVTVMIDTIAPEITASIADGTLGDNGWYTSDVTVHYECSDNLSDGVVCPSDEVLSDEGTGITAPAPTVTDLAGNESAPSNEISVNIDKTGPSAALVVTAGTEGENGWYTSNVTVSTQGSDSVSEPVTCTLDQDVTGETAGTTVSGSCTNDAGLTTDADDIVIMIDTIDPEVTIVTPAEGDSYVKDSSVIADWTATDANLDNVDADVADGAAIATTATGAFTFTVSASDLAGHETSVTHNYTVFSYDFGGFKSPLSISAKDFKKSSTIPVKFQLLNEITGLPVEGPAASLTINGSTTLVKPSGSSNVGSAFRYDPTAKQYIYNLATKQLTVTTYNLLVSVPGVGSFPATLTIK